VRWVLVEHDRAAAGVPLSTLDGLVPVYRGEYLDLYASPSGRAGAASSAVRRGLLLAGYLAASAVLFGAVWYLRRSPTTW